MPKYFMTWEVDPTRAPTNPKERGTMWAGMVELIKQDMKEGKISEWGSFVGESRGYSISELSLLDLSKNLQRFFPFVTFQVHQVMSIDELAELTKSLME